MEFRDSYRMEAIYFQTLKDEINRVKSLMASGDTEQAKTLLENAVNVDGAVLLLYRNLGELWGELGAKIEEVKKELEKLDNRVGDNLRELNEKIDDVNNTIIRLINALEERVKALEDCCEEVREELENKQDKLTPGIGIEISDSNVIDNTILSKTNGYKMLMQNYWSGTAKITQLAGSYLILEVNLTYSIPTEYIQEYFEDYNFLNTTYYLSLRFENVQSLTANDAISIELQNIVSPAFVYTVNSGLNGYGAKDIQCLVNGDFDLFSLQNFIKTALIEPGENIEFLISFGYVILVNGKPIFPNSPYYDILNDAVVTGPRNFMCALTK